MVSHSQWGKTRWCPGPNIVCIYFDGLLKTLCSSKIGCFVGRMFTGTLAYADDIVLLAPTPQAMRCMLLMCEKHTAKFGVVFNATKSKCIVCTAPFSKLAQDHQLLQMYK